MATQKKLMDALVATLLDLKPPPKARQGYQQFMHDSWETLVKPCISERWNRKIYEEELPSDAKPDAAFRMKVARDMFNALPQAERDRICMKAKSDAASAKAVYESALNGRPSTQPDVMQRAIDNIPEVLDATMMSIQRTTNLKVTVIYGGPDPYDRKKQIARCAVYGADPHRPELSPIHIPQYNPNNFKKLIRHLQRVAEGLAAPPLPVDKQASKGTERRAPPEVIDLTEPMIQVAAQNGLEGGLVDASQEVETIEQSPPEHPDSTYGIGAGNFVDIPQVLETSQLPPSRLPEPIYNNVNWDTQPDLEDRVTDVRQEVTTSVSPAPLRSEPTYKLGAARWDDMERMSDSDSESPPMSPVAEDMDVCPPFQLNPEPPLTSDGNWSERAEGKERQRNVPDVGPPQTQHVQETSQPSPNPLLAALNEPICQAELIELDAGDGTFPDSYDPAPTVFQPMEPPEPPAPIVAANAPSVPTNVPPPSKKRKRQDNSENQRGKRANPPAGSPLVGGSRSDNPPPASSSAVNPPAPKRRKSAPKGKKDGVKRVRVRNMFERGKWFWMEVTDLGNGGHSYNFDFD